MALNKSLHNRLSEHNIRIVYLIVLYYDRLTYVSYTS